MIKRGKNIFSRPCKVFTVSLFNSPGGTRHQKDPVVNNVVLTFWRRNNVHTYNFVSTSCVGWEVWRTISQYNNLPPSFKQKVKMTLILKKRIIGLFERFRSFSIQLDLSMGWQKAEPKRYGKINLLSIKKTGSNFTYLP